MNGKDAALDITVVSTLQAALVKKAGEEVGSAANKRYKEKQSKYLQPCANEGIEFFPMVVETLGGWHPDSCELITRLARQLASRSGGDAEETTRHLYQRLSILLNRGNSNLILSRIPDFIDAYIDGDVDIEL